LISIVDDDALARDGIRELVESLGYKAIAFESAQHFLASSVLAETTCLITDLITDLQMPGQSGLELQEAAVAGISNAGDSDYRIPKRQDRTRALNNGAVDSRSTTGGSWNV
jgi:FixJ family two-component response regulator